MVGGVSALLLSCWYCLVVASDRRKPHCSVCSIGSYPSCLQYCDKVKFLSLIILVWNLQIFLLFIQVQGLIHLPGSSPHHPVLQVLLCVVLSVLLVSESWLAAVEVCRSCLVTDVYNDLIQVDDLMVILC